MTREECERKIAEYCTAIRLTMLEYNPDFDYLDITIGKTINGNGNDTGNWDSYYQRGFNAYWDRDKDFPISFDCYKDIKDDKYWACVSEEEDKEEDAYAAYEGRLLPDGTYFYSNKIWTEEPEE